MFPLAYHITWTSYGTWLHGDERTWVDSDGAGIRPPDAERERRDRARMAEEAVAFTADQRRIIDQTIRDHCRIGGWTLHAVNVRTNHVHVVVSADLPPEEVMNQLKAWSSRKLSDAAGLSVPVGKKAGRRRWFTEHGSTKWINTDAYLQAATAYVLERQ